MITTTVKSPNIGSHNGLTKKQVYSNIVEWLFVNSYIEGWQEEFIEVLRWNLENLEK